MKRNIWQKYYAISIKIVSEVKGRDVLRKPRKTKSGKEGLRRAEPWKIPNSLNGCSSGRTRKENRNNWPEKCKKEPEEERISGRDWLSVSGSARKLG